MAEVLSQGVHCGSRIKGVNELMRFQFETERALDHSPSSKGSSIQHQKAAKSVQF